VTRQLNYFWFRECAVSARRKNSTGFCLWMNELCCFSVVYDRLC
jgi:hypothetical protein